VQQHITPQIRNAIGYSVNGQKGDLEKFQVPGPQYPDNAAEASQALKQSTDKVSQQGQDGAPRGLTDSSLARPAASTLVSLPMLSQQLVVRR
jgi:hypothetical protein